jgi:hypothetical protein
VSVAVLEKSAYGGNPPLGHFDFPRKSFTVFYFPDRVSWLLWLCKR